MHPATYQRLVVDYEKLEVEASSGVMEWLLSYEDRTANKYQ